MDPKRLASKIGELKQLSFDDIVSDPARYSELFGEISLLLDADSPFQDVRQELRLCRERIDLLSSEIDYLKRENGSLEQMLKEANDSADKLDSRNQELRHEIDSLKINEDRHVPGLEKVNVSASGSYLSPNTISNLHRILEMKRSKIESIESSRSEGSIDEDVADSIIDFLSTDISICEAILSIDFSRHESVTSGFKSIVRILTESEPPRHQDEYGAMLTMEESLSEFNFMQILNQLQAMMKYE